MEFRVEAARAAQKSPKIAQNRDGSMGGSLSAPSLQNFTGAVIPVRWFSSSHGDTRRRPVNGRF